MHCLCFLKKKKSFFVLNFRYFRSLLLVKDIFIWYRSVFFRNKNKVKFKFTVLIAKFLCIIYKTKFTIFYGIFFFTWKFFKKRSVNKIIFLLLKKSWLFLFLQLNFQIWCLLVVILKEIWRINVIIEIDNKSKYKLQERKRIIRTGTKLTRPLPVSIKMAIQFLFKYHICHLLFNTVIYIL